MRLFIYTICIFLFSCNSINAQNCFGIHANYGVYQLSTDIETFKQDIGYNGFSAGLIFRHYDEKFAGIQAELNLVNKGWHEKDSTFSYTRTGRYLELPIMTHLSLGKRNLKFIINFGPNLCYLISENKEEISTNSTLYDSQFYTLPLSKFEYGLVGGIGVGYTFPFGQLVFETRLNYELSNMLKLKEEGDLNLTQSMLLHAGISYIFSMKPVPKEKPELPE